MTHGSQNGIREVTSTQNTGGGTAHNNLQPYIVTNFIVKAKQSAGLVATVIDSLESESKTDALSANQGKILNEKIDSFGESIKNLDSSDDVLFVTEPRKIYMYYYKFTRRITC